MLRGLDDVPILRHARAVFAAMLLIIGALALTAVPLPAAAETAVAVPEEDAQSQEKQAGESGQVVEESDEGESAEADLNQPSAIFRNGCIVFPGQRRNYRFSAAGTILYRVVPSRFFDVTMRVNYVGLRSFFVDRFFAGGTESILIIGPRGFWPVRVTIGGFRGSTGCFAFSATP